MSKSLYSLILNDEVIKRIDESATVAGTNRSNLINQILAEYVSFTTPEKRIKHIFEHLFKMFDDSQLHIIPEQSPRCISIKTSLDYKYRPTIKYSVELYRTNGANIGKLKIGYRINSQELLYNIQTFFETIIEIERKYLSIPTAYEHINGKLIRTFVMPDGLNYTQEEIARAISDYIKNFDYIFKRFLLNKYYSIKEMELDYKLYISKSILI